MVRYVAAHAPSFGGHADQRYLAGHSAGGHLAALVSQQAQMPPFSLEYAPQ